MVVKPPWTRLTVEVLRYTVSHLLFVVHPVFCRPTPQAKPEFDTLGSTADEVARQHAEREAAGGAIPGPAPSELIVPVGDSMGKKLLRTMGWREGQGIGSRVRRKRQLPVPAVDDEYPEGDLHPQALTGLGKKARELVEKEGLTFAPRNTNLNARSVVAMSTVHGVGYEPFKDAPEFEASRRARAGSTTTRGVYRTGDLVQQPSDAGGARGVTVGLSRGPLTAAALDRGSHGFVLDDTEDDVYEGGFGKEAYDDVLDADGSNTDAHDTLANNAKEWALGAAGGDKELMLTSQKYARCPSDGRLPPTGFVVAQHPDGMQRQWPPPIPPASFDAIVKFEEDVVNPLRIPESGGRSGRGLSAFGRAKLLEEPGRQSVNDTPAAPPALPEKDPPRFEDGLSTLFFLSPAARKKLLDAANGARIPPGTSSLGTAAATPVLGFGGAGTERSGGLADAGRYVRYELTVPY